jgi:hypothetical protein
VKPFLLIANDNFYPRHGTRDWVGCFETREEAQAQVTKVSHHDRITRGPRKGQIKSTWYTYKIENSPHEFDWFEIVDLRDWVR